MNKVKGMLGVLAVASVGFGATCNRQQVTHTALDVAQATCVLLHDQIDDVSTLAQVCDVAEALIPELRKLIFARKSAAARKASVASSSSVSACPSASPSANAPTNGGGK